MNDLMTFDVQRATQLGSQVKAKLSDVEQMLNSVKTTVESDSEQWWKGQTRDAYLQNLEKTSKDVKKQLENWLESYNKLVTETAKAKQDLEKQLASKIKG